MLSGLKTPEEFVAYLTDHEILRSFIRFAAQEGVREKPADIRISEKVLRVQLCAYIARNFLDNQGFYPIIREIDSTLLKAVGLNMN